MKVSGLRSLRRGGQQGLERPNNLSDATLSVAKSRWQLPKQCQLGSAWTAPESAPDSWCPQTPQHLMCFKAWAMFTSLLLTSVAPVSEVWPLAKCSLAFRVSGCVSDTNRQRPPSVQGQADKLDTTASLIFLDSIKDSSHLRFVFLPLTQVLFPNILLLITTACAVSYLGRETLQEIYF